MLLVIGGGCGALWRSLSTSNAIAEETADNVLVDLVRGRHTCDAQTLSKTISNVSMPIQLVNLSVKWALYECTQSSDRVQSLRSGRSNYPSVTQTEAHHEKNPKRSGEP